MFALLNTPGPFGVGVIIVFMIHDHHTCKNGFPFVNIIKNAKILNTFFGKLRYRNKGFQFNDNQNV